MFDLKLLILCFLVVLKDCVSALDQEECFKDDFGAESLGLLNRPCIDLPPFNVQTYADFIDVLEKPPGSNSFFIAANIDSGSCIENSEGLLAESGTDIVFFVFTKNPQPIPTVALWMVEDITSSGEVLTIISQPLLFSSSNDGWKIVSFNTPRDANIRVSTHLPANHLKEDKFESTFAHR